MESRSCSRIKAYRHDKSPWDTELSMDESSSDTEDFSFDSNLASTLLREITTPENFPLPEGDNGDLLDPIMDNKNLDSPLTQFVPNLPCAMQERQQALPEAEESQASDETHVVTCFFSNTRCSLSSEENAV